MHGPIAPIAKYAFLGAAGIAVFAAVTHELIGGPMVLGPLENPEIPRDVAWLHRFSWHVGTVALATMASLFAFAALAPGKRHLAYFSTGMSLGFGLLGMGLAVFGDPVVWTTPAPYPWTIITALGAIGLFFSQPPK